MEEFLSTSFVCRKGTRRAQVRADLTAVAAAEKK